MVLRISKKEKYEQLSIVFLLLLGAISNFVEHSGIWNACLIIVFFVLLIGSSHYRHTFFKNKGMVLLIIGLVMFCITNVLVVNASHAYLSDNLLKLFKPLVVAIIIITICREENTILPILLRRYFYPINVFWVINLIVTTIQVSGYPLFIKTSWLSYNSYYEDQCCGLFGNSGTHILSFFAVFVLVYNLYIADYVEKKRNKVKGFAFLTAFWMLILSTMNDNNGIFVLYAIFVVCYYMARIGKRKTAINDKIQQYLKYSIVIILLFSFAISLPGVNNFINDVLFNKLNTMINIGSGNLRGSNERLAIAATALIEGFGWRMGIGIGSHEWTSGLFYGFSHFGLSSIGGIIFLCGIWFYLYVCIMYTKFFVEAANGIKNKFIDYVIVFFVMIIISIFTTIFTFSLCMIWLSFIYCIFSFVKKAE